MSYRICLDIFEGPLDLLLYLVKREEIDIYDIPITRITEQYLETLNLMELLDLEIAGDFLVMAATLMHIKSKMLLPPDPHQTEEEEADPRAELVRRLLEYKAYKEAAEKLRGFELQRSSLFTRFGVEPSFEDAERPLRGVTLFDLLSAFSKSLANLPRQSVYGVMKDEFSVSEKIHEILHRLAKEPTIRFSSLYKVARNKFEIITAFLALLELMRLKEVHATQEAYFGEIEISRNIREPEPQGARISAQ